MKSRRMQVVVLAGGGHIAELRLLDDDGSSINLLWESPWETADPGTSEAQRLGIVYGGMPAGPFLAGFTGHALCLDIFGPPSPEEAEHGVPLHGEASMQTWKLDETAAGCIAQADLAHAQLHISRSVKFGGEGSVLLVEEVLENLSARTKEVHWVQHVSLGPPLLELGGSSVTALLDRCKVWPHGYEGCEALRTDAEFLWPWAPAVEGGVSDLRIPFQQDGRGFLVAGRVAQRDGVAYIAALNLVLGVVLVYCFRSEDFPWVAIWEENCARDDAPWNGNARVRGMEFGTTPMPTGRDAIRAMGRLFDRDVVRVVPARGSCSARYVVCGARVPREWRAIEAIRVTDEGLELIGVGQPERVKVYAAEARSFLSKDGK